MYSNIVKSYYFRYVLPCIALSIVLSACQQVGINDGSRVEQRVVPHRTINNSYANAMLVLGSEELVDRVTALDPRLRKVGQFTQAQVTVQNLTDDRIPLEYMYRWEDKEGFMITKIACGIDLLSRHIRCSASRQWVNHLMQVRWFLP